MPTSVSLSFTSPSGCGANFSATLSLVNTGGTEVSQVCPTDLPNTNCNTGGTIPGTEVYTYSGTVTFPVGCTDWTYSYNLCCRNSQITNLTSPSSQDFFIDGMVNTTVCNNSPQYASVPTPYICAGQPFCYSLGTSDTENDSLVFTMVQPMDGPAPGTPIPYVAPMTVNEPLTSTVPWTFDPASGEFCFTPDVAQIGVVKIQVDEYDNGVLIGTSYRELQIIVQSCTNVQPVFDTPPVSSLTGGVLAAPTIIEVCPGDNVSDPNGDNITMSANMGAFPGATWTTTCVCTPVTGTFNWTPGMGDIGTHFLSINIQDDGCPILGTQFLNVTIIVLQGTLAGPDLYYCPGGGPVQLNATGGAVFTWTPSAGLSCTVCPSPIATPSSTTTYTVTSDLSATCDNTDDVTVFVVPDFVLNAGPDVTICENQFTQLNATSTPAGTYTYVWSPIAGLSNPNIANPTATPSATTTYTVTATSAAGCIMQDDVIVTVSGVAPSVTATVSRDTVCPGDTVQLNTILPSGSCSTYTVSSIAYAPIGGGGWTSVTLGDDQVSPALNIGFSFDFYCNPYTQFWLSSNGWMTFTSTTLSDLSEDAIPNVATPNNIIAFAWDDIAPNYAGTIAYKTIGAAPNRILVMRFVGIPHCCSAANPKVTTQVLLYETTNTIEIHSEDVNNDGGTMTQGIENIDGTVGVPAPGRNQTIWTATNDAYRWELPILGGPFTYTWVPPAGLNDPNIDNPIATVNGNTTYTVTVTDINNPSCSGNAQVTVGIETEPTVVASPDLTFCIGTTQTVALNAVVTGTPPPACGACGANGTTCTNPITDKDIGTGTASNTTTGYPAPYGNWYKNGKTQLLYLASELTAAGLTCGTITSLGFDIASMNTTPSTYKNFEIKLGCTAITSLTTWQTGLTTVFTPKNVGIAAGWTAHPFDLTYDWDGTSNIVVEICFDNRPDTYTQNASTRYTVTGFTSALYYRSDVTDACPITTATTSSNRPNIRFSSCSNSGGGFTYTWSPTTGLSDPNIQNPTATVSTTIDYIITVTGGLCDAVDTATITFINCTCTPANPSGVITNVSCNGDATGAINLSVSGGVSPYTYLWSSGPTSQDISGLIAGTYTVTVSDNASCDSIMSFTITEPTALTSSVVVTNESCL